MERKNKEKITCTIDRNLKNKLGKVAEGEGLNFSSVVNDCLKLGFPEFNLYLRMKRKFLDKRYLEIEKKLKSEDLIKD